MQLIYGRNLSSSVFVEKFDGFIVSVQLLAVHGAIFSFVPGFQKITLKRPIRVILACVMKTFIGLAQELLGILQIRFHISSPVFIGGKIAGKVLTGVIAAFLDEKNRPGHFLKIVDPDFACVSRIYLSSKFRLQICDQVEF